MALRVPDMHSAGLLNKTAQGEDWRFHHLCKDFFKEHSHLFGSGDIEKRSIMQHDFMYKISREALWTDSRKNAFCLIDEFSASATTDEYNRSIASNGSDAMPVSLVWACCKNKDLLRGSELHREIKTRGLAEKIYSDALVTMYAKCGELQTAQALLDMHNSRSFVPWNAVIAGCIQQRRWHMALNCFDKMQHEGVVSTAITYSYILKACSAVGAVDKGKHIHNKIMRQGLLKHNVVLGGALVDMYAKCGDPLQAHDVLRKLPSRDVISWSALIAAYTQNGQGQQALLCLEEMKADGVLPNAVTYACILKACASIGAINKGKQIHDEISRQGFLEDNVILGSALVDMYAKCGALSQARDVLEKLQCRDTVCWSALIGGYAQNGQAQDALHCLDQMQAEGLAPDAVTYVCVLQACASTGDIEKGKQIHNEIMRQELLQHHVVLGGALVDMYAKCGALSQAQDVLEKLPSCNDVCWSALIAGYAKEGKAEEAFKCYERMKDEGILPDTVTCLSLLNVCNHLGLVAKAQEIFDSMKAEYGLTPSIECFNCLIDLLGRAGHLGKAVDVIRDMPFACDISTWHAVLGACCKYKNVIVGSWAFEQVLEMDKSDAVAYVLMADVFMAAGLQEKANDVEIMRIKNRAWKLPGCSLWTQ